MFQLAYKCCFIVKLLLLKALTTVEQFKTDALEWEEVTNNIKSGKWLVYMKKSCAADGESGDSQRLLCCRLGAQESAALSIIDND